MLALGVTVTVTGVRDADVQLDAPEVHESMICPFPDLKFADVEAPDTPPRKEDPPPPPP